MKNHSYTKPSKFSDIGLFLKNYEIIENQLKSMNTLEKNSIELKELNEKLQPDSRNRQEKQAHPSKVAVGAEEAVRTEAKANM